MFCLVLQVRHFVGAALLVQHATLGVPLFNHLQLQGRGRAGGWGGWGGVFKARRRKARRVEAATWSGGEGMGSSRVRPVRQYEYKNM